MNLKITIPVFVFLFTSAGNLFSEESIKIYKTSNPPVLDGRVNDKCWETASSFSEFLQREPDEGQPMTEKTEVFICFNADYIYFGIKCYEDPNLISSKEMLRDASLGNDDRIAIILDTYNDHRNAYFFGINALGAIEDATVNQNGMNNSWNGLFVGKSKITDIGWEAEISIPFKSLGFDKNSDHWGLLMNRFITKKNEWGSWPVANINSSQFQVSDAGIIEGLEGITQGVGLDISPYLISGFDTKIEKKTKYKINGGTDMFYQLTPSMKTSLSINTDFAETEADSRQINLTRFNIRLSEKRGFFLDGSNYFTFGLDGFRVEPPSGIANPFFSRTIGLNSEGSPIPINYGAKLTGSIKNWNIGLLNVSDDRDYGNSNFSVGRVKYNMGKQSSIGMIGTYGNSIDSSKNNVVGLDLKLASSRFLGNKNISFILYGLKSTTENINGKDASWGGTISYPNDLFNLRIGHVQIGENFKTGIGYVPRSNIKETFGSLTIGPRLKGTFIRQISFGGDFDYVTDFSNKLQSNNLTVTPLQIIFESGEIFRYSIKHIYDFLENDFNIYSTSIIPADEYKWWVNSISLITKGSRDVYGSISYGFGDFYNGRQNSAEITANWKIAVPIFIGSTFSTNNVKLPESEFTANITQVNVNFLFSPNLTLYNYLQYDSQSEVYGWQSRFRWILKPGNEILLVWNSGFSNSIDHYIMNESALRFKLKYNIRF